MSRFTMSRFTVLVCGGRNYDNRDKVFHVLDSALEAATLEEKPFVLIHGGAKGADALSGLWASTWKDRVEERVYKADWATHGRAAGPIRNRLMFTESDPDVIIAFEGGAGTANMTSIGIKSGCPIYEVKE